MSVQRVGRFEGQHRATGAGEREQHRLEDLVGAVGTEDLFGADPMKIANGGPQRSGAAIGIAMPGNVLRRSGNRFAETGGRWPRSFVGVEPDVDVDLGRVIALERGEVVTNRWPTHAGSLARSTAFRSSRN